MFGLRTAGLAIVMTTGLATPAYADLTAFFGANTVPSNRPVRGLAVGFGMLVGFEFEYANTSEDREAEAPALLTGTASALIQPPLPIAGVQPYFALGVGLFRERLDEATKNNVAVAMGGGLKVQLAGPLRLRIDYRGFRLNGARHSPAHRFYAGLNLAF